MPKRKTQSLFKLLWRNTLSDYVTAIAWSQDGTWFVASSVAGEVVQYDVKTGETTVLQGVQIHSVDALAISADGQFLAASGQAGTVWIWRLEDNTATLIETLEHSRAWIDCLQWNPHHAELAFSLGRYVQVWDATSQSVITTLNFDSSTVLDLAWHPQGNRLSASGHQIIKTWQRQDWDDDPTVSETGGTSEAIAWSPDGTYFASGNSDCSVLVWKDEDPYFWHMQDFSGKVRELAWSMPTASTGAPLLASISSRSIVVWTRDLTSGWNPQLLDAHQGVLSAIAFQPKSLLLASAAEDGSICFWHKGSRLTQTLKYSPAEFSCLGWNPSGETLSAGTRQGDVLVWSKTMAGKGFG